MAKNGFRIMDSDMHVMEPADLYEKFMEPQYLAWAPKLTPLPEKFGGSYTLMVDWQFKPRRARYAEDRERLMGSTRRMRDATASMREQGYNAASQLEAMDIEGIDVAVLFPTVCLNLPNSYDNVDGSIAAALCRAYNNWLYEFCQTDPQRLKLCGHHPGPRGQGGHQRGGEGRIPTGGGGSLHAPPRPQRKALAFQVFRPPLGNAGGDGHTRLLAPGGR